MIKEIWFSVLSLFIILFSWTIFADVIDYPRPNYSQQLCVMFDNVDLWNYRVIIYQEDWEIYELPPKTCLSQWWEEVFLLDKSIDIDGIYVSEERSKSWTISIDIKNSINNESVGDKAILLNVDGSKHQLVWWRNGSPKYIERLYKIDYNSNTDDEPKLTLLSETKTRMSWVPDFPWTSMDSDFYHKDYVELSFLFVRAWLLTILVETLLLFLIAKSCRKSWPIKNRKIFITWILASTVTLPLLWFVLPMFFSNYLLYVIFWEILVTVIETFIIKYSLKIDRKMAIFASIVCNLFSFLIWLFIF